jgi:hypothetical protein
MVSQADLYYLEITRTIDLAALWTWEHEVKSAERLRSTDLRVMDIYAARIPECAAGETAGSATTSASSSASAPLDQWMEYLLLVEETQ